MKYKNPIQAEYNVVLNMKNVRGRYMIWYTYVRDVT